MALRVAYAQRKLIVTAVAQTVVQIMMFVRIKNVICEKVWRRKALGLFREK